VRPDAEDHVAIMEHVANLEASAEPPLEP
jgi:hypothetical protein